MRQKDTKPKGFTLIELLVVIAIISLLAAILFPVFAAAREKARQSTCASNLKQIALGVIQYTQDYDDCWPIVSSPPFGWVGKVYPYIKSTKVFQCPDDPTTNSSTTTIAVSYAMNYDLTGNNAMDLGPSSSVRLNASQSTVLLCEIRAPASSNVQFTNSNEANAQNVDGGDINGCGDLYTNGVTGNYYDAGELGNPARTYCNDPNFPTGRHTGMGNFAFCDGHVKALPGALVSAGLTPVLTGNKPGLPSCDQDQTTPFSCEYGSAGNAAGTDRIGVAPKNFVATFSPI